jgi:hypothetical protein
MFPVRPLSEETPDEVDVPDVPEENERIEADVVVSFPSDRIGLDGNTPLSS